MTIINLRVARRRAVVRPLCALPTVRRAEPPLHAVAKPETPLRQLCRQWESLTRVLDSSDVDMTEEQMKSVCEVRLALERRIMAMPCDGAQDMLLKLGIWTR